MKLVPCKRFSQTSGLNNYLKNCFFAVGFQDERGWKKRPHAVLPFKVWLVFYGCSFLFGIFRTWEKICKNTCYKFFTSNSFALLPSSRFNLHVYFRLFWQTTNIEMLWLIQKEKNYMRKLWYANYKKQYCTSQEEIFSWNTVLYPPSQFLHKIPKWSELPYC